MPPGDGGVRVTAGDGRMRRILLPFALLVPPVVTLVIGRRPGIADAWAALPGFPWRLPAIALGSAAWNPVPLIVLALLAGVSCLAGRAIARLLPGEEAAPLPLAPAASLGLVALSFGYELLCLAGAAGTTGAVLLLLVGAVSGLPGRRRGPRHPPRDAPRRLPGPSPLLWLAIPAGAAFLIMGLAPTLFYDAHTYLLSIPEMITVTGRWPLLPNNHFAHFPYLATAGTALADALGGPLAAQCFLLLPTLLAALVVAAAGGGGPAGWTAAVLLLATPTVAAVGSLAATESFLLLGAAVMVFGLLDAGEGKRERGFLLIGIGAGSALASKYTAYPLLLPGALLMVASLGPSARTLLGRFLPPILLLPLPHLVREACLTGDPLHPLLAGILPWSTLPAERAALLAVDRLVTGEPLLSRLLSLPRGLLLGPEGMGAAFGSVPDLLPPLLLAPLAAAPLLVRRGRRREAAILALVLLSGLLAHSLLFRQNRFLLPLLAPACVLAVLPLRESTANPGRAGRCLPAVVLLLWLTALLPSTVLVGDRLTGGYRFAAGGTPSAYLDGAWRRQPIEAGGIAPFRWLNGTAAADDRVLLLGQYPHLHLERDRIVDSFMEETTLAAKVRAASDPEQLFDGLRGERIRYLLVNQAELGRLQGSRRVLGDDPGTLLAAVNRMLALPGVREIRPPAGLDAAHPWSRGEIRLFDLGSGGRRRGV